MRYVIYHVNELYMNYFSVIDISPLSSVVERCTCIAMQRPVVQVSQWARHNLYFHATQP